MLKKLVMKRKVIARALPLKDVFFLVCVSPWINPHNNPPTLRHATVQKCRRTLSVEHLAEPNCPKPIREFVQATPNVNQKFAAPIIAVHPFETMKQSGEHYESPQKIDSVRLEFNILHAILAPVKHFNALEDGHPTQLSIPHPPPSNTGWCIRFYCLPGRYLLAVDGTKAFCVLPVPPSLAIRRQIGLSFTRSLITNPKECQMAKSKLTPKQIEEMYDSGELRLTQERNDFLLPQVTDFVKTKKWINIRPEYQRRLVWDAKKKSLFIESLLMNIPVPPIFLYEYDLSRYEVMDGQQRLNAILEFYDNTLKLRGLETWDALNGLTYGRCPPRIQRGLDRRRISATVLIAQNAGDRKQGDTIRREVFERLNTGGLTLNAQELRNSLYSGPFNDLIVELAGLRLFNEIWEIPPYEDHYRPAEGYISSQLAKNEYFKRMRDCEIVLRFFAFRDQEKIKGAVKAILDRCMAANRDAIETEIDEFRDSFTDTLDSCFEIFGDHTFRLHRDGNDDSSNGTLSIPLFDAVMVAVEGLSPHVKKLKQKKNSILAKFREVFADEEKYETLIGKANTAQSIKDRLKLVYQLMKSVV